MSRPVWTVDAIAEVIGKSPNHVRQLIRDDKLAAKREGKTPLILDAVFQDFLQALPDA